jgi:hypothetical protein
MPDDVVHEGEPEGGTQNIVKDGSNDQPEAGPSAPRKRPADEEAEGSTVQQTQGKKVDYRHLNNPFSDEEVMSAKFQTYLRVMTTTSQL